MRLLVTLLISICAVAVTHATATLDSPSQPARQLAAGLGGYSGTDQDGNNVSITGSGPLYDVEITDPAGGTVQTGQAAALSGGIYYVPDGTNCLYTGVVMSDLFGNVYIYWFKGEEILVWHITAEV